MAASYTVTNITKNGFTLTITRETAYSKYRVFIRLSSDTSDSTFDGVVTFGTGNTYTKTFTNLKANTSYTINVGKVPDQNNEAVDSWIGAKTFTTLSSSSGGGGTTSTYYYRCYDETNSTYLTTSTSTTSSSITRPSKTGYTYKGYKRGTSWSNALNKTSYTSTNTTASALTTAPYIVFCYEEEATDWWYATTTYQNKLSSYTSGGSTSFTFSLNAAQVGYCKFTPTASGTITVYSAYSGSSSYDMYGYLVAEGVAFDETASAVTGLFSNYLKRDDDSQGSGQFKITYNVTANTSYRIYFCAYSKTTASSGSIYFTFEATPSITAWQTPVRMASISGSSYTTYSTTSTVNKYNAGYVHYITPSYAGKIVFETTSGSTSPDYYSYLSTSTLSAGSGTSRSGSVTGAITSDDDGASGDNNYDTLISYECNASTAYYWYVNAAWANSGTYSIPWKLNYYRKYTITYNANNGTGAPSAQSFYADNTTVSIPNTTPTRSNHTFLGWSTSASATSATYTAGSSPTLSAQDYTLYAVWKASTYSITITYDANGGTGAPSASTGSGNVGSNINIQISSTEPTKDRHIFKGWADGNSTTVSYQSGQTYPFSSNKTLYAVWENKFGADNVYYCVNGAWKLCEVYYCNGSSWLPVKTYYGSGGTWKNNT